MALTSVTIEIANVATPEASETIYMLVDSGAVYSVVQTRVLHIAIERTGRRTLTPISHPHADSIRP